MGLIEQHSAALIRQARRRWFVLLLVLGLLLPLPAHAQDDTLRVPAEQQQSGDVATTGRDVMVEGVVDGDITTWSGDITIRGHVTGDVVSYSGDITLDAGAQVDGHVLALAGTITEEVAGQVAGRTLGGTGAESGAFSSLVDLFGEQSAGAESRLSSAGLSIALAGITLLLATTSAWRWPRRTVGASHTLRALPGRSVVLGSLTTLLLATLLLPISALLAITLIGLPLVFALLLALHIPYVYGLAAVAQVVGSRLLRTAHSQRAGKATALGAVLLLVPLVLLGSVAPTWGAIVFYLIAGAGLGAVILSRGGALVLTQRRQGAKARG